MANPIRDDLTAFGFGGGSGSSGLVTRIETLEENVETLEDDIDKAFLQMNYSTNEHLVGEWVDGSPIYEKTYISNTLTPNSDNEIGVIENVKTLISMETTLLYANGGAITNNYYASSSDQFHNYITPDWRIIVGYYQNTSGVTAHCTVRYTKN